jgi:hypothetical protein
VAEEAVTGVTELVVAPIVEVLAPEERRCGGEVREETPNAGVAKRPHDPASLFDRHIDREPAWFLDFRVIVDRVRTASRPRLVSRDRSETTDSDVHQSSVVRPGLVDELEDRWRHPPAEPLAGAGQPSRAITSISTLTSRGRRETCTVDRAGGGAGT